MDAKDNLNNGKISIPQI